MSIWSLLVPLVVMVQSVGEVRDPRPTHWVTDQAGVVDDADEAALEQALGALHGARGVEVAVVTVDDVPGTPKAFATSLFNAWHLGDATRDDGVLLLLVVKQHRLEIETGDGLQTALTAAWLAELQRTAMVPRFKQGLIGAGLRAGVDGLAARLTALPGEQDAPDAPGTYRSDGEIVAKPAPLPAIPPPPRASPAQDAPTHDAPPPSSSPDRGPLLFAIAALGGLGVAVGGVLFGAVALFRRINRCACGATMVKLDERADDAHLAPPQQLEERIGSVDYIIHRCPACQAIRARSRERWFSHYANCAGCGNRTSWSETTTLNPATHDADGLAEVHVRCVYCARDQASLVTLARLTRPTSSDSSSSGIDWSSSSSDSSSSSHSSSSSSDSSSGGGHSSGGGAGSSW